VIDFTPVSSRLSLKLDAELRWMQNEWFFKWHSIGGNEPVEIDSFDGRKIRYGGIAYFGSPQTIFWDTITRYLRQKIEEIFGGLEEEIQRYPLPIRDKTLDQAGPLIVAFAQKIRTAAIEKDRVLRGNGFEKPAPRDQGNWQASLAPVILKRIETLRDIYCIEPRAEGRIGMGFQATVLKIMIASPGDVIPERVMTREVIHEWNAVHADKRKIVLLPVGWETHSYPEMGQRPQAIINKQILADADILIAAFWTKLGTPTGSSASGTAEEISEHISAGKPALLYFSAAPVKLDEVDPTQYAALTEFKKDVMQRGLIEQYESLSDFREKLTRQLASAIYSFPSQEDGPPLGDPVSSPRTSEAPSLSPAAEELLVEASKDGEGIIMSVEFMDGAEVSTNGKNMVGDGGRREIARWRGAVTELERRGYVEDRGGKGEVFFMTHDGYTAADHIASTSQPPK
jgi:hypothetical protein